MNTQTPLPSWQPRDLPTGPVTRFAPSPTGLLHLGHVVNAIYVWGVARAGRGTVQFRIEDHDRQRSRAEYDMALREDLAWLGFVPDTGGAAVARQSERPRRYERALATLRQQAEVYACDCSRRDIGGERYSGRCRTRGVTDGAGHGLRVRLPDTSVRFRDLRLGEIEQHPASQCGDLLIRDRDGQWTYQFAVVVDDLVDDVTLIVRGEDLLSSTARQILLAGMLGRVQPATFLHHPLVYTAEGRKLSKSAGDAGVRQLRADGATAPEVIGRAARLAGLPVTGALDAARVSDLFAPAQQQ